MQVPNRRLNQSYHRQAFTLVELVLVLATIAALAVLVSPSISRAREAARRAACLSNLRGIGTLISAYRSDTGVIPLGSPLADVRLGLTHVQDALNERANLPSQTIADVAAVWRCPSDTEFARVTGVSYENFMAVRLQAGGSSGTYLVPDQRRVRAELSDHDAVPSLVLFADRQSQTSAAPHPGNPFRTPPPPGFPGWMLQNALFADNSAGWIGERR